MALTIPFTQPPAEYALCKDVQFQFDTLLGVLNTSGVAPANASYVVLSANTDLTSERILTGTASQITVTDNGAGSTVVLSLPQNIATGSSPTFASLTLSNTSNQLVLGNTRTVTLTAPTPASSSRTVTIPDLSGNYDVVGTIGTQSISGVKTFSSNTIFSSGDVDITNATATGSNALTISDSATGIVSVLVQASGNNASSHGLITIESVSGDAKSSWKIGSQSFSAGIDNSTTNDDWVLSWSSSLGTNDIIQVAGNSGQVTLPQKTTLSGGDTAGNPIRGATSNSTPSTGYVGEVVLSTISTLTNFPSDDTYGDLTSISLTAGNWVICAVITARANGATVASWEAGISSTSGNSTTGLTAGYNQIFNQPPTATYNVTASIPAYQVLLTGTTTYYLKYTADYTVATPQARGTIFARRIF